VGEKNNHRAPSHYVETTNVLLSYNIIAQTWLMKKYETEGDNYLTISNLYLLVYRNTIFDNIDSTVLLLYSRAKYRPRTLRRQR